MSESGQDCRIDWLRDLPEDGPAADSTFIPDPNYVVSHGVSFAAHDPASLVIQCQQHSCPQFLRKPAWSFNMHDSVFGSSLAPAAGSGGIGMATQQNLGVRHSLMQEAEVQQIGNANCWQQHAPTVPGQRAADLQHTDMGGTQGAEVQQNWATASTQQLQPPVPTIVQPPLPSSFLQTTHQQGQHQLQQAAASGIASCSSMPCSQNMAGFQLNLRLPLQATASHTGSPNGPLFQAPDQQQQQLQLQLQLLQQSVALPVAALSASGQRHTAWSAGGGEHAAGISKQCRNSKGSKASAGCRVGRQLDGRQLTKSGAASQRYRERQRSLMDSLQAEVGEKMAQLQVLVAENEMLKLRASVLESAVCNRENTVKVTRAHGPPVYDLSSCKHSGPHSNAEQHQQQKEAGGVLPPVETNAEPGSEAVHGQMHTQAAAAAWKRSSSSGTMSGTAVPVAPGVISSSSASACPGVGSKGNGNSHAPLQAAAQMLCSQSAPYLVKEMSVEDVLQHWQQCLQDFSHELVLVQQEAAAVQQQQQGGALATGTKSVNSGSFDSLTEQRLKELTDHAVYLFGFSATLNPAVYCQLFGRNLETGIPEVCDDTHWRHVLGELALTDSQARHILACSELYFPSLHKLQQERRILQQQLQASGPAQHLIIETDGSAPMLPILEALATNLKREHVLRVMMTTFVWDDVLKAVQKAKCAVYSHPLFPDTHAMVCVLALDRIRARLAQGLEPRYVFPHRHDLGLRTKMIQEARLLSRQPFAAV